MEFANDSVQAGGFCGILPAELPGRYTSIRTLIVVFVAAVGLAALASGTLADAPARTVPADRLGQVTLQQVRAAARGGLLVGALSPAQRKKLPQTPATTRIHFFKREGGRQGVMLVAPPAVEERKARD